MPDRSLDFMDKLDQGVVSEIEARLALRCGGIPVRLSDADLEHYPSRQFVAGWRIPIVFADDRTRRIDILLSPWFPKVAPRTALADHPGKLTWPHVEEDGILCLLSNSHDMDLGDPASVIDNLMARSCTLIDQLIEGSIVDRDFKEEFLTYWDYDRNSLHRYYSLLDAGAPSRQIHVWHGRSFSLVGESEEQLARWLKHRFDGIVERDLKTEKACFLWLDPPPVPSEYPQSGMDLLEIATRAGPSGLRALEAAGNKERSSLTVILGAGGRAGPGFLAVQAAGRQEKRDVNAREHGFRKGNVPDDMALQRLLSTASIRRCKVQRADALWVHGRGRDQRAPRLAAGSVVLLGCGSIGSSVAAMLLRAGVGTLTLVDCDWLEWANVSRHELGGAVVGLKKAVELAQRLQRDFPHATVNGYDLLAEAAVDAPPDWLSGADLVISTTGSGQADKALNDWHRSCGREIPIVYGWTEPFGGAGHAIAIAQDGGCLNSGVNKVGLSTFEMTRWEAGTAFEEPACGVHYAPYGAIELAHVNSLVAQLALDCLLGRIRQSTHVIWAALRELLNEFHGDWTEQGLQLLSDRSDGGTMLKRDWPQCDCCPSATLRGAGHIGAATAGEKAG